MVTVHREAGYRFVIYKDDHEPAHVHAIKDGEVIVNLGGPGAEPEIRQAFGASIADVRRVLRIVVRERDVLRARWKEIHGGTD
ncbi:MAG: DUF4160 domain-containing protein [Novosphingobium sp.]